MKSRVRRWLVPLVVLLALFVLARFACRPTAISVEAAAAGYGPVEDLVTNSEAGSVRSRAQSKMGADRAGVVAEIRAREGARVRAGEVVVALDRSTAERRLEAARRDLEVVTAAREAATAAAVLARRNFERLEKLRAQQLVSTEQMDEARSRLDGADADLRAAQARVASAAAAVKLATDEIEHLVVRAPFSGVITRRFVEVGESVIPGQPLLEVMSPDRLYVSAPIDERDAGRLAAGQPARVTLDTYPGVVWSGRVKRLAPMVEEAREQNRTLEVEVDLPADDSRPRPGMTADVEIVLARRDRVLRIPSSAVTEGRKVLTVRGDQAVERAVKVGLRNWDWSEVLSGVAAGDRVITSLDRAGLKAGVRVAVQAPTAADSAVARARGRESGSHP